MAGFPSSLSKIFVARRSCGPNDLLRKSHVKNKSPSAVHLVRSTISRTVPQAAARSVTDHWLTKLAHALNVDGSMCKTVMSKSGGSGPCHSTKLERRRDRCDSLEACQNSEGQRVLS